MISNEWNNPLSEFHFVNSIHKDMNFHFLKDIVYDVTLFIEDLSR